eukprot:Clim_evm2s216 gene=Clim_evmTU2s216
MFEDRTATDIGMTISLRNDAVFTTGQSQTCSEARPVILHWQLRDLVHSNAKGDGFYYTANYAVNEYPLSPGGRQRQIMGDLMFQPTSITAGLGYVIAGGQEAQLRVHNMVTGNAEDVTVGGSINNSIHIAPYGGTINTEHYVSPRFGSRSHSSGSSGGGSSGSSAAGTERPYTRATVQRRRSGRGQSGFSFSHRQRPIVQPPPPILGPSGDPIPAMRLRYGESGVYERTSGAGVIEGNNEDVLGAPLGSVDAPRRLRRLHAAQPAEEVDDDDDDDDDNNNSNTTLEGDQHEAVHDSSHEMSPSESLPAFILVSNNDRTVKVVGLPSNEHLTSVHLPCPVNYAAMSPDGRSMVTVGDDKSAVLFDVRNNVSGNGALNGSGGTLGGSLQFSQTMEFTACQDTGFSCCWDNTGVHIAIAGQDGHLTVFDVRKLDKPMVNLASKQFPGVKGAVRSVKYSPKGSAMDLLAFSEHTTYIHLLDARTYSEEQIIRVCPEGIDVHIAGIAWLGKGDALVTGMDTERGAVVNYFEPAQRRKFADAAII